MPSSVPAQSFISSHTLMVTPSVPPSVPVEVVGRSGSSALVRGEIAIGDPIAGDGAAWITPAEDHE